MYTLTSHKTGEVYPDTRQGRDLMDTQENRRRLSSMELEALIVMTGCWQVMKKAHEKLRNMEKYSGCGREFATVITLLGKAISKIMDNVSAHQVKTLHSNTSEVTISVSSAYVPGNVNISIDGMVDIANQALDHCALTCTASREESKRCTLRKALECVPGMKDAARANAADPERCPYIGLEVESEEA